MICVIEDRIEYCDCDEGVVTYSGMGPVDNTDVWEEQDACGKCDGRGYIDIEEVLVEL